MTLTEHAVAEVFQAEFEQLSQFPRMNMRRIEILRELSNEVRSALGAGVDEWTQATEWQLEDE